MKSDDRAEHFAIGELVVMRNATYYSEWNGALGVVVGELTWRTPVDLRDVVRVSIRAYRVRILAADGMVVTAKPHQLRKLGAPGENTSKADAGSSSRPQTETVS